MTGINSSRVEISSRQKRVNTIDSDGFIFYVAFNLNSSVIKQKVESKTEVTRKQSTVNFLKKVHFLSPDTHAYVCVSGGQKCSLFGKFGVFCFLVTSVLRSALLPYYRRVQIKNHIKMELPLPQSKKMNLSFPLHHFFSMCLLILYLVTVLESHPCPLFPCLPNNSSYVKMILPV